MNLKLAMFLSMTALMSSLQAVAAPDGQLVKEVSAFSNVAANFSASLHGPALNHLTENATVDSSGKQIAPSKSDIYLDSTTTLGYRFGGGQYVAGAYVPFFLIPSVESTNSISDGGKNFVLGDAGIYMAMPHAYKNGGFSVSANLILQAPTSAYSKNVTKMDLGIKTSPSVRYAFSGTGFTLGTLFEFKEYVGVAAKQKSFKTWYMPYAQYNLAKSLDARLAFEYEASHYRGGSTLSAVTADFQPGLVWFVTEKVMFNPYVQIFTNDTVDTDHMTVGAFLSASM